MARLWGFKNLVYAVMADDESYGSVYTLPGAVNCDVSANNGDPYPLESDDVEKERLQQSNKARLSFEIDSLAAADEARIFGRTIDSYGVVLARKGDTPPYVAIGFKCAYTNDVDEYVWFYKASVLPDGMNARTREKGTVAPVTKKLEFDAIERNYDGAFKNHILSNESSFASKKASFFNAPYVFSVEPYINLTAQPANAAVTVGSVSGTLSVTAAAVPSGSPTYQWYKPTTPFVGSADTAVSGATSASLTIPTNLTAGNHYFYCKIMLTGANTVYSYVAQVIASE